MIGEPCPDSDLIRRASPILELASMVLNLEAYPIGFLKCCSLSWKELPKYDVQGVSGYQLRFLIPVNIRPPYRQ